VHSKLHHGTNGNGHLTVQWPPESQAVLGRVAPVRTRVTKAFTFEAAHDLPMHPGKCQRLHGHGYRLEISVEGPIGADGMVIDFEAIKDVVDREVVDHYDHRYLNDLLDNPTAERLAHEIWERLAQAGLAIAALRLWETPTSYVDVIP
jgi:6-pyruvoyltetrahydropterin/6-carboxytetrahydropterin synthase